MAKSAKNKKRALAYDDVNEDDGYEKLSKSQRLKAAFYYSIKQISKEVEDEMEVSINSQVLACLSECLDRQVETYANDLELFARHGKRTTINVDDVKLLVRKNPVLVEHLEGIASESSVEKETIKKPKKTGARNAGKKNEKDAHE